MIRPSSLGFKMKKRAKIIVAALALMFGIQSIALPTRSSALVGAVVTIAAGGPVGGVIAISGLLVITGSLVGASLMGANSYDSSSKALGWLCLGILLLDGEDGAYSPIAFQPLPESALQKIPGMTAPLLDAFNNEMEELTAGMEDNAKTATETLAAGRTQEQALEISQKAWRDSGISADAIQAAGLVLNHAIQTAN